MYVDIDTIDIQIVNKYQMCLVIVVRSTRAKANASNWKRKSKA